MSVPLLQLKDLQVCYGSRVALDVPELAVSEHETLAVIGPNGAGKTTLLHALALLLPKVDRGALLFRGKPLDYKHDGLAYRRRVAVVFQEPLLCDASVYDNVALGLRFRWRSRAEILDRANLWLERLGIEHLRRCSSRTLSGGEAQRVSLARAFAVEPEVLLLDEPFSALDAPTRAQLVDDLRGLLSSARTTTVFVTHHRGEALMLGDRIVVLAEGRVQQMDEPSRVFTAPINEAVANIVGMEMIVPATILGQRDGMLQVQVNDHTVSVVSGEIPWVEGEPALVCLRPEDIHFACVAGNDRAGPPAQSPGESWNRLTGRIAGITPLGGQFRVKVDCGFPLVALVNRPLFLEGFLKVGNEADVHFRADAAHLIRRHERTSG